MIVFKLKSQQTNEATNGTVVAEVSKADTIFNTEIMVKKLMKDKKYLPLLKFSGFNESFDVSISKKIIKIINNNIN